MGTRLLNAALILIAIVGCALSTVSGYEVWRLSQRRDELVREVGLLPIGDGKKACLVALESDGPMHFRWRVFTPANFTSRVSRDGSSHTSYRSQQEDFFGEFRMRVVDGRLLGYESFQGGSSLSTIGSAELVGLVGDRWSELEVEQLGADGRVFIDRAEPATLVRIRLPREMVQEAETQLNPHEFKRVRESLVTIKFGDAKGWNED